MDWLCRRAALGAPNCQITDLILFLGNNLLTVRVCLGIWHFESSMSSNGKYSI